MKPRVRRGTNTVKGRGAATQEKGTTQRLAGAAKQYHTSNKTGKAPTVMRPKTEEEIWSQTKAAAKGKYLSTKSWKKVRSLLTNKTGWTTAQYDAWMANKVNEGKLQTAKSNPAVGSQQRREEAVAKLTAGKDSQTQKAIRSVRDWLKKRVSGDTITAPMVRQMEKNLTAAGDTTHRVAVAIITVAAEAGMKVEDRREGRGKAERNWLKETQTWAKAQNIKISGVVPALRDAAMRIQQHPKGDEAVCLEEGSGWEGATKGLRQAFDRVITSDIKRQTIRGTVKADPDLLEDIVKYKKDKKGWVQQQATKAGVRKGELQAIWISPPCTEESTAQGFNKGKKWAKGLFGGKARSKKAQAVLDTLVEGAWKATREIEGLQMCMENPWVTALAKETSITSKWGAGIKVVGCAYGAPTKKPYRLWMTPATEREFRKVKIGPSDKASACAICKKHPNRRHDKAAITEKGSKRKRTDTTEANGDASKNRVPWQLAKQVGECMRRAYLKARSG